MAKINISERVLRSVDALNNEIRWQDYLDKERFTYYCDLMPDRDGERITIGEVHEDSLTGIEGFVYVFVINGRILKIGQSITLFKKRVTSYNCGKQKARDKGTCSVTNYFILQSILKINVPVKVYLMVPTHLDWEVLGETGTVSFPPVKIWERKLLERFTAAHCKSPIGNSQK